MKINKCKCSLPEGVFFRSGWHAMISTYEYWFFKFVYDLMVDNSHENQLYTAKGILDISVDLSFTEKQSRMKKNKETIKKVRKVNQRIIKSYYNNLTVKDGVDTVVQSGIMRAASKMYGKMVFLERCPQYIMKGNAEIMNTKRSNAGPKTDPNQRLA